MTLAESKRLLFLTGDPAVGKTTVLLKVVDGLKAKGYSVTGMVSREVRSCGSRVGFEILDLGSDRHGWLAHVSQKNGPQVGKYRVNIEGLNDVGVRSLMLAVDEFDVIVIDEIGPMELCSGKFSEAVKRVLESGRLVVGIIHRNARSSLIDELKARKDFELFNVTFSNREHLHEIIIEKAVEFLNAATKG
ncbi:MAG TPA: NTPase [Candidatus Bathyarchaeia archaeon]|nr:NTPase [Candidatus Bathyarchaeia archaeon]